MVSGLDNQREKTLVAIAGTGLSRKMRERPLTIATYAAGASLAAATLVYVFGPTFFLDDEAANSSKSSRKKGVVGLVNPANDCFINSVLQVLAGLPELRAYLIREVHRRKLEDHQRSPVSKSTNKRETKTLGSKDSNELRINNLQRGVATAGLKDVLDALNERPIYKKTISASPFIRTLEQALGKRVNRNQQDAQEFLQVVLERLSDERDAGIKARSNARQQRNTDPAAGDNEVPPRSDKKSEESASATSDPHQGLSPDVVGSHPRQSSITGQDGVDNPLPMIGNLESQIECSFCAFKPKASISTFQTLTLNVPYNETSTSLNACFDGLFKAEQIDDFACDRCCLEHALQVNDARLKKGKISAAERLTLEAAHSKIKAAILKDPEHLPKDVELPSLSAAPKRRISRHVRISAFPELLTIHLSRSVWDRHAASSKNSAKVSFPETLSLGGLIDRKSYRLLGLISHKGFHNSGHYETFRRQVLKPPFSTPNSMGTEGIYSLRSSPVSSVQASVAPSPHLEIASPDSYSSGGVEEERVPAPSPLSLAPPQSSDLTQNAEQTSIASMEQNEQSGSSSLQSAADNKTPGPAASPEPPRSSSAVSSVQPAKSTLRSRAAKRKHNNDRWWRISDDKIKECKTNEVLSMQQEVYMLFYELLPTEKTE